MEDLLQRAAYFGVDALGDAELLALVLGESSARALIQCTEVLLASGGVSGLSRGGGRGLERLGARKAARLAAALELGRRACTAELARAPTIDDSERVAAWGRARLGHLDHEELWMLAIDGQRRLRAERCVARGGLHGLQLHVRDPLRVALREGASAVVLVHNHPSGDPTPSQQDVEFTLRFAQACDLVATPLVDHVVIGGDRHTSMLSQGLFDARAPPQNSAS